MSDFTLIYPHQLFEHHHAIKKGWHVAVIEDSLFFGDKYLIIRFHKHKLIFHRCTMKLYADRLQSQGHSVTYINYDRKKSSETVIEEVVQSGYDEFHCADLTDLRLSERIRKAVQSCMVC